MAVAKKSSKKSAEAASFIAFLAVYLLFAVNDLQTSAQTGNSLADRSLAHICLSLLTGYLVVSVFFTLKDLSSMTLKQPLVGLIALAGWILLCSLINQTPMWSFLVQMNMSVLWVISYLFFWRRCCSYSPESLIWFKRTVFFLMGFFSVAIVYYFVTMSLSRGKLPVLNVVYYLEALLPWAALFLEPKQRDRMFLVSAVFVFLSMKRGAIIALVVMYVADVLCRNSKTLRPFSLKKWKNFLIAAFAFFVVFLVFDQLSGGFLSTRFSSDELATGGGRTDLYAQAIDAIRDRDWLSLLVGSGPASSAELLGTGTHNEWLEMLFSYGVIGLILYTALVFGTLRVAWKSLRSDTAMGSACMMMIALYGTLSLVSTGYGGYTGLFLFGFWGCYEGFRRRNDEVKQW